MLPLIKNVSVGAEGVTVEIADPKNKKHVAALGTMISHIRNMMTGVTAGFTEKLEINGVGYNWNVSGTKLTVKAGYSHPVIHVLPAGVTGVAEENKLTLSGIDKQLVGETAALIRKIRPPEPYKGKGIKYVDEHIQRKAGKQAAGAGA
jgi:large subunit ribosomal protein L6